MTEVLVVDDSPEICALIEKFISSPDIHVTGSVDSYSAMEILEKQVVDLLICDINMPFKDGLSFVSQLRRVPRFKMLPILIISARNEDADIKRAIRAGANGYLIKPIVKEVLVEKVKSLLKF